ncbi:MAG TPA: hypothetical protein EYQ18_10735 [Candidatus Handelsmanbacteria bacterium]|nr:hypothetical protein [Candidatus Handelsmanbacteria bacterium]
MVKYCDRELRIGEIADYDGAHNGLQVENAGKVRRIAAAVDASLATVRKAALGGADLLVAHHGLFWNAKHPWTGPNRRLIGALVGDDASLLDQDTRLLELVGRLFVKIGPVAHRGRRFIRAKD